MVKIHTKMTIFILLVIEGRFIPSTIE